MSSEYYRNSIKALVDSVENEKLLKHWQRQLEWDVKHQSEIDLTEEEWDLVNEGIEAYKHGEIISLEEFIESKK